MMGDALIGGQGGFALQTMYVSFQQAEVYEARFRSTARRLFGDDVGTPSFTYYLRAEDDIGN